MILYFFILIRLYFILLYLRYYNFYYYFFYISLKLYKLRIKNYCINIFYLNFFFISDIMINLKTPIYSDDVKDLKVGDVISITGTIYTARDQAHKRIVEDGEPFSLDGQVIFHAGPIIKEEANDNYEVIAIGPTTSMRMNPYEADVIEKGVRVIIGKGGMDENVRQALIDNEAIYTVATGGCAALYVDAVLKTKDVTWLDLGIPEAMWELEVESFGPLIVAMDSKGNSLYD